MRDPARDISGIIICSGGTGYYEFTADGTLDTVWFSPRAPDTGATYDFEVDSVSTNSKRWSNINMEGAHLEVVDRAITRVNRIVISNCSVADAVFDIVLHTYSSL